MVKTQQTPPRQPNSTDKGLGEKLRARRTALGLSQERLADQLGITFQHVQKYEKGTNRISASRLVQIANALGISIDFFYDSQSIDNTGFADKQQNNYIAPMGTSAEGLKLINSFQKIKSLEDKQKLLSYAEFLASQN